jgi:CBS domain-containing protein
MQLMRAQKAGAILICENGRLVGIFTERDALRLMASSADLQQPLSQVMSANPVTVSAGDTVATAIEKMSAGGYRRLPIVDDSNNPTGVVGVHGLVHYLVQHFPGTVYNLPPVPRPGPSNREGA